MTKQEQRWHAMSDESVDGKAYFVFTPRNGEVFQQPHLIDHEKPYRIVGNIALSSIDYENFETDMLVEHEYLEPYEECCRTGETYACVLVHKKTDDQHGFLVIPDSGGYIKCAAWYRALGIGNNGWGAEGAAWAEREGLLADTGMTADPAINCPRSAVVTFLYRELG